MTKYSPQNAVQAQPRQSGGRFGSHKTAAPEAATSAPTPALDGTAKREPPQPWQEALVLYQLSPALYAPPAHQLVSIGLTPEQARARSRVLAKDAPFYNLRRFVLTSNQPDTLADFFGRKERFHDFFF
jgi:hypothetical protein